MQHTRALETFKIATATRERVAVCRVTHHVARFSSGTVCELRFLHAAGPLFTKTGRKGRGPVFSQIRSLHRGRDPEVDDT